MAELHTEQQELKCIWLMTHLEQRFDHNLQLTEHFVLTTVHFCLNSTYNTNRKPKQTKKLQIHFSTHNLPSKNE